MSTSWFFAIRASITAVVTFGGDNYGTPGHPLVPAFSQAPICVLFLVLMVLQAAALTQDVRIVNEQVRGAEETLGKPTHSIPQ